MRVRHSNLQLSQRAGLGIVLSLLTRTTLLWPFMKEKTLQTNSDVKEVDAELECRQVAFSYFKKSCFPQQHYDTTATEFNLQRNHVTKAIFFRRRNFQKQSVYIQKSLESSKYSVVKVYAYEDNLSKITARIAIFSL